jgi:hypothetical protein
MSARPLGEYAIHARRSLVRSYETMFVLDIGRLDAAVSIHHVATSLQQIKGREGP